MRNGLLAVVMAGPALAATEPATVVVLGDSLTAGYGLAPDQGFVPRLQAWLEERGADAVIQNAGVSGDTTAGGLSRVDWALTPETDAVIVELGGNDFLRGLDPTLSRENLRGILEKVRDRGLPVLLVGIDASGQYGPDYEAAFDGMYPDLAQEFGALLEPDFFAGLREGGLDLDQARAAYLQPDGIHPNAEGVERVVERIGPRVLELIGEAGAQ